MSDRSVNEQILNCIREECKNNEDISNFLIELIYEEAEHSDYWRWKDTYRKKIKEYSKKRSEDDEN